MNTSAVQADWANRDFSQGVQLGVAQLAAFLNDFGAPPRPARSRADRCAASDARAAHSAPDVALFAEATTRSRLASLNGKLAKLERRMEVVEATLLSVDQGSSTG